jgi:hypothetical protein
MKIQFGAILKDRHGKDMAELDTTTQPPKVTFVTLGAVCCTVLDSAFQDEANEGTSPKMRRFEIMKRITEAEASLEPLELLDADVEMIKQRIGKRNFTVWMTGAAIAALVPVPESRPDTRRE